MKRTHAPRATRRQFLQTAATMATVTILPSGLLKAAPNDKPNIAAVGVGGKGWGDITETSKNGAASVVAFCDVDTTGTAKRKAKAASVRPPSAGPMPNATLTGAKCSTKKVSGSMASPSRHPTIC